MRDADCSWSSVQRLKVFHAGEWSSRRRIAKYPNGLFLRWWRISELVKAEAILPPCVLIGTGSLGGVWVWRIITKWLTVDIRTEWTWANGAINVCQTRSIYVIGCWAVLKLPNFNRAENSFTRLMACRSGSVFGLSLDGVIAPRTRKRERDCSGTKMRSARLARENRTRHAKRLGDYYSY